MIKNYFFPFLLLFVLQSGFSQTEKIISGKVLHERFPVEKVDVVNFISKKVTITNAAGEFSILAKAGDELIFISKNHDIKKIVLDEKTIDKNNLLISLILKPEELKEVVITKMPSIQWKKDTKWEKEKISQYAVEKAAITQKVIGINTGTIENGISKIKRLYNRTKETPQIEFKQVAKSICDQKFYLQTLKLKPDQIELFLQFCDADPKSTILLENSNVLSMMDFLSSKSIEFKKL
ncbi:hypothetical protein [Flavobacterium sp. W20_MBD1_R3]|uniref:hypothetical protein n=1 Tax=Flavobacterium sp. W20_MBD1_R3 TaxID=3240278 RepID=UPI003F900822